MYKITLYSSYDRQLAVTFAKNQSEVTALGFQLVLAVEGSYIDVECKEPTAPFSRLAFLERIREIEAA